jgi:hypothetical protein
VFLGELGNLVSLRRRPCIPERPGARLSERGCEDSERQFMTLRGRSV